MHSLNHSETSMLDSTITNTFNCTLFTLQQFYYVNLQVIS